MNKKKIIYFLSLLLFICFFSNLTTYSYVNINDTVVEAFNTNTTSTISDDILSKKFMLQTTPIGSEWHYTDAHGGNLFLVLNNIEKTKGITTRISFRGAYSECELFSIYGETLYFEINFLIYKNKIFQKVWDSKSNSSITSLIHSIEDFSPKKISLNFNEKLATFSLEYIFLSEECVLKNMITDEICKNYMLGEKVLFSKQNDISMDWYRGIDTLEDEYYSNGAHHTILMMLDWLYSNKQDFKHRPIYMFGENDMLTDESVKDAISVYSEYSIYTPINVTEELITHNLNEGYILILKINPENIAHETNMKSHKGIYYYGKDHYIIIKGFAQIDNSLYFTAYDPHSLYEQYDDGSYKGKDRFYRASDILDTINNTGTNVYVIKTPKTNG
ncbi:hypothetical protein [Oceanirhabdus seepicola]|uniref:Uncharacterized protein n=1 Tax=Oceanirhabdus seepicola TaxID=2828781 RepID=A0A9J6NZH1_9CLOT|nr:hypothetical protein [Oceanirhabdus seepicola]MCM1989842.1 hypothetical protein [Oceanirhabdus seepicola]